MHYLVPPVAEEPQVSLVNWCLRRYPDGDIVLTGQKPEVVSASSSKVRTTSPIEEIDPTTMTVKTASGRIYHLFGEEGPSELVRMTFDLKCRIAGQDAADGDQQSADDQLPEGNAASAFRRWSGPRTSCGCQRRPRTGTSYRMTWFSPLAV